MTQSLSEFYVTAIGVLGLAFALTITIMFILAALWFLCGLFRGDFL